MTVLNNTDFEILWLGTKPYSEALSLQDHYFERLKNSVELGFVLALEHEAVITLGKRGDWDKDIQRDYKLSGLNVVEIDRGGQATLHSPGQLVVYPILNLRRLGIGVKQYVEILESATIESLSKLGIIGFRDHQPGVFTKLGKVAFVGVRVRHGISTHGISINFSNDLALFQNIRSCGVSSASFDRIWDHNDKCTLEQYFQLWIGSFLAMLKASSKTLSTSLNTGISEPNFNGESSLFSSSPIGSETTKSSLGVVGSASP